MTAITVFGKPNCIQCKQTVRAFEKAGLIDGEDFTYRDVTEDPRAYAYVTEELGYSAAPVIVLDDQDHWSGFNPTHNRRAIAWATTQRGQQTAPAPTATSSPRQAIHQGVGQAGPHPVSARAPDPTTQTLQPGVLDLSARLAQLRETAHTATTRAAGLTQTVAPASPAPLAHQSAPVVPVPAPVRQMRA